MSAFAANLTSGVRALLGVLSGRRVFAGPRTVALIVADDCNSNCVMCWYHSPLLGGRRTGTHAAADQRPRFMDAGIFESIVRQCRELGTLRVVLGGTGETALHPRIDAMLELIVELGMRPYVITNGLAVGPERARRWADLPVHVRFSLHAGDPDTWLAVHPSGTAEQFEQICESIAILAASKTAGVSVMHVIQRANYRNLVTMVEHARSLRVGELVILPVRAEGPVAEVVVLDAEEERELLGHLVAAHELAERWGLRTTLGDYLADGRHVRAGALDTSHVYHEMRCTIGWIYAEFDIDGTMRPCEGSRLVLGQVGETPVATMWRSAPYREFRRAAHALPTRRAPVPSCACDACCMVKFNRNVHDLLRLRSLSPGAP